MPPPQPSVQEVQSAQSASLQSTLGSSFSGHGCACMRGPSQGFPPFSARAWTALVRYCWPVWLQPVLFQAVQSSSSQSTGRKQSLLQGLVSSSGPLQGFPWQEPSVSTARLRVHSCAQLGSDHGLQAPNWQSVGVHWPSQAVKGQGFTSIWLPLQGLLWSATKRYSPSFSLLDSVKVRWRIFVEDPHVAEQSPMPLHSDQAQNSLSPQFASHASVSRAEPSSHGRPHELGCLAMPRFRMRCPAQEQSPHSLHSPHSQSLQVADALQASAPQDAVTIRSSVHGSPPFAAGLRTCLRRFLWPPSQVAEHSDQSSHSPTLQLSGVSGPHSGDTSSPGPGLQGSTSFRLSLWHDLPPPEAIFATCLARSRTPKHLTAQRLHSAQSDSSQSCCFSHGGSSLQSV
mmetsp:Transcript_79188/g.224430  ORF Transcript_79188/g.224430 Transcript_79188/m.224430 type:complete len:399 (-) Transcript_79188:2427-3623(-)